MTFKVNSCFYLILHRLLLCTINHFNVQVKIFPGRLINLEIASSLHLIALFSAKTTHCFFDNRLTMESLDISGQNLS